MKNKIKIGAMAMGILLLAGCGNQAAKNQNQSMDQAQNKNGVISSIKDAMGLGKSMKCEYKFQGEGEDITSTAYVNGKKYKAESTVMGKKHIAIFDEEAMYSWSDGEKTGMKMTKACMEEMEKSIPKDEGGSEPLADSISDEEFFDNATDVKCQPYSGADFSIPKDIVFADQCEMLKNMMKNFSDIGNGQSGANMPQLP